MAPLNLSILIDEKKIARRVNEIGKEITQFCNKELKGEPLIMACVLKGSFMFYSDLIRAIDADIRTDFIGCSSYGDATKSTGEVKLTLDLTHSIEGKHVMIVEDIIDTGLTMNYLSKTLSARNPKRIMSASLLLKPDAMKVKFKADYVGFEIANDFVVGYGLDYQGYYRNLAHIARVENLQ